MLNRKYKQRITWTCLLINFLSCWISVSFLEPRQLTRDVWASIRKEWLRSWTAALDKTTSLMLKCTSAPTVAYPPSQVRTCEAGINHNIVDLNIRYAINLEEGQFLHQKPQKKINSELQVRIKLTTLWVLVWTLQPLSYWRLYGEQGRN